MRRRERNLALVAAIVAAGFLLALGRLFVLRFEAGDVYPPYSTLRTDPLGAKVLFDGLAELDDLAVGRNYRGLWRLTGGAGVTMLILAAEPGDLHAVEAEDANGLTRFVAGGGRLVVTFSPRRRLPPRAAAIGTKPSATTGPAAKKGGERDDRPPFAVAPVSLAERWGFAWADFGQTVPPGRAVASRPAGATLPAAGAAGADLSWHTYLHFDRLDPAWRVIYRFRSQPAIIERKFGSGSIVLAADTFFASNEAMRTERRTGLVAWLVGPNRRVVFDETHLGVREAPGVMALVKKYGMEGVFATILLLAGLFVWKNATSLVPRRGGEAARRSWVEGKDSAAGLVNLLRRAAPKQHVLGVCLEQWKRTIPPDRGDLARKARRMRDVVERQAQLPRGRQDPVAAYRKLVEILAERK